MLSNFLDLFSGIGGFALGAYWAGMRFDHHYFSEVDPYAIRVYNARFPDAEPLGDIRNIRGAKLPAGDWIIAGGFPCQDISVTGKGAGLSGERSGLWYDYARIIGELRPRYAIMENVGALTFRGLDSVLGSLAALGYDADWQDIRASDVGAPHRRERIWIVAYPKCDRIRNEPGRGYGKDGPGSPEPCDDGANGAMANATCSRAGWISARSRAEREGAADAFRGGQTLADAKGARLEGARREGSTLARPTRRGWWAVEPDVGRVAHGVPSRVDRLKCLGNSIVPQIAEMIFRGIAEQHAGKPEGWKYAE